MCKKMIVIVSLLFALVTVGGVTADDRADPECYDTGFGIHCPKDDDSGKAGGKSFALFERMASMVWVGPLVVS